jgi:serine protease AprX
MKITVLNLIFILALGASSAAADQPIDQTAKKKGPPFPALVILKEQADLSPAEKMTSREEKGRFVYEALRSVALKSQGPLVEFLNQHHSDIQRFYISNMIAIYDATPELVKQIAARDDVAKILDNPQARLKRPKTDFNPWREAPAVGPGANLVRIGADRVWNEFKIRGEGIVIGGADTGVDWQHPALKNHYRGFDGKSIDHSYSWHDAIRRPIAKTKGKCGIASAAPCDDQDHGTHTMGTMIGDDDHGNQIGVAPGAKWIACRNMDQGIGRPTSYIECFEYFLAPYAQGADPMKDGDPSKAPNIINNSWTCSKEEGCRGDELLPALQAVSKAGIMVVASAGNEGPDCGTIHEGPAMFTGETLTIGAFNHRTDKVAGFSSRGPSALDGGIGPALAAPGVDVLSSIPGGGYEDNGWSGTSMAGPHAVGAIALLWSANHRLIGMIPETKAILFHTATPNPTTTETCGGLQAGTVPNNISGYGFLDVYHAVHSQVH